MSPSWPHMVGFKQACELAAEQGGELVRAYRDDLGWVYLHTPKEGPTQVMYDLNTRAPDREERAMDTTPGSREPDDEETSVLGNIAWSERVLERGLDRVATLPGVHQEYLYQARLAAVQAMMWAERAVRRRDRDAEDDEG